MATVILNYNEKNVKAGKTPEYILSMGLPPVKKQGNRYLNRLLKMLKKDGYTDSLHLRTENNMIDRGCIDGRMNVYHVSFTVSSAKMTEWQLNEAAQR